MEAIGWTSSRERRPFPLAWPTDDGGCRGVVGLEAFPCHLWRQRLNSKIQGNFPSPTLGKN